MNKVDFVIAWVDGSDPKHQAKRQHYQGVEIAQGAVTETRFASDDEIYFSVASILKYVPYCGTIYVVTDQQKPQYIEEFEQQQLCAPNQIQVVDHQILFDAYTEYLPTFNSLTIETMLWRIPDLSDYFIYLNDDFFFNSNSSLDDFLLNEKIKVYGHWQSNTLIKTKFQFRQLLNKCFGKKLQPKYTIAQMLSADMLDLDRYFEIHHRPHMLARHFFRIFFEQNDETLKNQIQHRFRSAFQFLPVGLFNHLVIQQDKAVLEPDIGIAYLKNQEKIPEFIEQLSQDEIKFGCIQSLNEFAEDNRRNVQTALMHKFQDYLPQSVIDKIQENEA